MQYTSLGGPEALQAAEVPDPVPGVGEVTIDVQAVGCNFADVLIGQGKYQVKPALPFAPGSEVAGSVRAVGDGVSEWAAGDRVLAMIGYGGYATAVCTAAQNVYPLPDSVSFEQAAALGVVYQTAYLALVGRAGLTAGETVVVHAAAGGAGLAAVQVARALDARVIATASSERKLDVARANGAHETVDYSREGWHERVLELTGGRGADVIYDSVGGDVFERSMKCVAFAGRIVVLGFASGDIPAVKLNRVMLKNIALVGLHLGAYREHAPAYLRDVMAQLFELHAEGRIRAPVSQTRPLEEASDVLQQLATRRTTGKIVLVP